MPSQHERYTQATRRQFLETASGSAAALLMARGGYAHHHGKPMPQSLPYLDQRTYLHNMEIIGHVPPAAAPLQGRAGQIMAIGRRRFLRSDGVVLDVTDPRKPEIVNERGPGGTEIAYNAKLKKWILMEDVSAPNEMYTKSFGKYELAEPTKAFRDYKGFRGVRFYDATNPEKIELLSEFNTGPTGAGGHGDQSYYDGGQYAYVGTTPDDSFTGMPSCIYLLSTCLMILDVSDPANPVEVSRWWMPGQRNDEVKVLKRWPCMAGRANDLPERTMSLEESIKAFKETVVPNFPAPDRLPWTNLHGPVYVPKRVEDGGRLAFGGWSSLGFLIHDLSDIRKPRLLGTFDPSPTYGAEGIPFHTIWLGPLERGFVVTIPESLNPDCNEEFLPNWVVDVRDPRGPVPIATLGRPKAPPDAPFTDFCFRRGRYSAHRPPYLKSPGRMSQTFLPVEYFNAGIQCYDLSEPTAPREVAYFVPPMGGELSPECRTPAEDLTGEVQERCLQESNSFTRPCNGVSVEWDRKIIYAGTTTGLYVLSCPAFGKPIFDAIPIAEWSLPHLNVGAP